MSDNEKSHDPFAEFDQKPQPTAAVDSLAMALGGLIFGALLGAGAATFLAVNLYVAGGIGAGVGLLVGWMTAGPSKSGG